MHVYTWDIQLVVAWCVCQITHQISKVNLETTSQRYAQTSHTLLLEGEILPYIWSLSFITIVWKNAHWQTAELTERERCFQLLCFHSCHQDCLCITKETVRQTYCKLLLECALCKLRSSLVIFWTEITITNENAKHESYLYITHSVYKYVKKKKNNQPHWWRVVVKDNWKTILTLSFHICFHFRWLK